MSAAEKPGSVLPLTYLCLPKSARAYLIIIICMFIISIAIRFLPTPFVRSREVPAERGGPTPPWFVLLLIRIASITINVIAIASITINRIASITIHRIASITIDRKAIIITNIIASITINRIAIITINRIASITINRIAHSGERRM